MAVEQQAILNALQTVLDPNTGKDFVITQCAEKPAGQRRRCVV